MSKSRFETFRDDLKSFIVEQGALIAAEGTTHDLRRFLETREALERVILEPQGDNRGGRHAAGLRRGHSITGYAREMSAGEQFLVEYRADSTQPFRSPLSVLDAVAAVFETRKGDRGVYFSELFEDVKDLLSMGGSAIPAEYLPRTCLRFLQWIQPPLVVRDRGRYRIKRSGTAFQKSVVSAFRALPNAR